MSKKKKPEEARNEFEAVFNQLSSTTEHYQVWHNFIYLFAYELANEARCHSKSLWDEAKHIEEKLSTEQIERYRRLREITRREFEKNPFQDYLGNRFEQLGLAGKDKGQFFTPLSISTLMGKITLVNDGVENLKDQIRKQGFIKLADDAIGAGSTIIGTLKVMEEAGIDWRNCVYVKGVDVSEEVLLQCYIQLSLMGAAATLFHGDCILNKMYYGLITPAVSNTEFWVDQYLACNVPMIEKDPNNDEVYSIMALARFAYALGFI